ncbi:MAG TPA: nitroreductase [Dehalococcoidia bacterium]|jgi:nitroreductase|nr:nitroreductase [Dehalococcoidia bacterium]
MELVEAIKARKSIRGYKPDPVPKEVLNQILDIARHSPSGVNNQPWEFVVLTGDALERAKGVNAQLFTSGAEISPDIPEPRFTGPYRERQIALAKHIFALMDIARENKEKRQEWGAKGMRFYDAPAAILICIEEEAFSHQLCLIDIGIVVQTIALAALEFGLGTCIQHQVVLYPEALKRALGLPESKRLAIGLAIGYPDWDFPANKIPKEREPLDNLVTWKG